MSIINKNKAADIIDGQINKSLNLSFKTFSCHPVRLIQASKALIGLDLDNPNQNLLNFNKLFLNGYTDPVYGDYLLELKQNEVISVHDLEIALYKKDKKVILSMFDQISKVSSSAHILEFLIEVSLKQSGKSFLHIWSLYKCILFSSRKESKLFIYLAIDIICLDNFEEMKNRNNDFNLKSILSKDLSENDFDLLAHLIEAYNAKLVRCDKIIPLIKNMIYRKFDKKNNIKKINLKNKLFYDGLVVNGRFWILNYINEISLDKFSYNFILFLDSFRSIVKNSKEDCYSGICINFERLVKVYDV